MFKMMRQSFSIWPRDAAFLPQRKEKTFTAIMDMDQHSQLKANAVNLQSKIKKFLAKIVAYQTQISLGLRYRSIMKA